MYFRTIILSALLAVEIAGVSAIASSWGNLINCRGAGLNVRMTLPTDLPQTRREIPGATMVFSQNGNASPEMRATVMVNDGTNLEVMAANGFTCQMHKVIDFSGDFSLSGQCGMPHGGGPESVVCQMGERH